MDHATAGKSGPRRRGREFLDIGPDLLRAGPSTGRGHRGFHPLPM